MIRQVIFSDIQNTAQTLWVSFTQSVTCQFGAYTILLLLYTKASTAYCISLLSESDQLKKIDQIRPKIFLVFDHSSIYRDSILSTRVRSSERREVERLKHDLVIHGLTTSEAEVVGPNSSMPPVYHLSCDLLALVVSTPARA